MVNLFVSVISCRPPADDGCKTVNSRGHVTWASNFSPRPHIPDSCSILMLSYHLWSQVWGWEQLVFILVSYSPGSCDYQSTGHVFACHWHIVSLYHSVLYWFYCVIVYLLWSHYSCGQTNTWRIFPCDWLNQSAQKWHSQTLIGHSYPKMPLMRFWGHFLVAAKFWAPKM